MLLAHDFETEDERLPMPQPPMCQVHTWTCMGYITEWDADPTWILAPLLGRGSVPADGQPKNTTAKFARASN